MREKLIALLFLMLLAMLSGDEKDVIYHCQRLVFVAQTAEAATFR